MLLSILTAVVLVAFIFPDSRAPYYLLLAVIYLVIVGNLDNPDRDYYILNYDLVSSGKGDISFEPGYQLLASLGSSIGFSYPVFHGVISLIALVLISSTILRYSVAPSLVLVAYVLFPLFWDVTQVRNFYAMAITVFGARYIIEENYRSSLKYILCVLIASSFHITSLFYLSFLIVKIRHKYTFVLASVSAAILSIALTNFISVSPILSFIGAKADIYTSTQTSLVTKIAVLAFYFVSLLIIYISSKRFIWGVDGSVQNPGYSRLKTPDVVRLATSNSYYINILKINIVVGVSVIFALNNLDFIRLYRNIFILNSIFIINGVFGLRQLPVRVVFGSALSIYFFSVFLGFVILISTSDIIGAALTDNIFSESLRH